MRAIENRYNNFFFNKDSGECACHTKEIFARNSLLTVQNLIAKNCLTIMQKVYVGLSPQPIENIFCKSINVNRRRAQTFFNVPLNRLKSVDNALPFKGPKFYNTIINRINERILENIACKEPLLQNKFSEPFKNCLKLYLLTAQAEGDSSWTLSNFPLFHDLLVIS